MATPTAIVLRAPGTNCDEETAAAWTLAGARAETWHVGRILSTPGALDVAQILTIPGGFSFGDDLGAGTILASRLGTSGDALGRFRDRGGLILGICNGFQVLVRAGLLPGGNAPRRATLTRNDSGRFESRWVRLAPSAAVPSPFFTDDEPIELPVAHGEGKFVADAATLAALDASGQIALRYIDAAGLPTAAYPANPNGSPGGVAAISDATGRVFGLMPHPERHIDPLQHPRWTRRGLAGEGDGLRIFRNAVEHCRRA